MLPLCSGHPEGPPTITRGALPARATPTAPGGRGFTTRSHGAPRSARAGGLGPRPIRAAAVPASRLTRRADRSVGDIDHRTSGHNVNVYSSWFYGSSSITWTDRPPSTLRGQRPPAAPRRRLLRGATSPRTAMTPEEMVATCLSITSTFQLPLSSGFFFGRWEGLLGRGGGAVGALAGGTVFCAGGASAGAGWSAGAGAGGELITPPSSSHRRS